MRKIAFAALFIAVALISAIAAEAQPSTTLFRHIPTDADGVYHFNLGSLFSKIDYHSIFTTFSKGMPGQQERQVLTDMLAGLESGVDLHSDLILTQSYQYFPDSPRYITMLLPLTDSGRFMTFIRTHIRALRWFPNTSHQRVLASSQVGIAWDARLAVLVFRFPMPGSKRAYNLGILQEINARKALTCFRGSTTSYFATDPIFIKAFSDDGDAHIWNRHSAGFNTVQSVLEHLTPDPRIRWVGDLVKAGREHSIGTLRAEAGRITYTHLRLTTRAENASLKRIIHPPLSPALLASVPSGHLIALATLHFDPHASLDNLEGGLPIMDSVIFHLQGLTIRDLSNTFAGDFLLLAYLQDPFASATERASPAYFLVGTVTDTAAFTRIAAQLHLDDAATPLTRDTVFHKPFNYYGVQGGLAVLSTTPDMTKGYFDHLKMSADLTSKLSSPSVTAAAFSLELDTHAYAEMTQDSDEEQAQARAELLNRLDGLSISTGLLLENGVETKYELTTADHKSNGLATLLYIMRESMTMQHRR